MPDRDTAGLVQEQVLESVSDREGRGLAAEGVEDLDQVDVLVTAGVRGGDDEAAVGQAVQVPPAGPRGVQLGEFDVAARIGGDDPGVEGPDIAAGLPRVLGKQPVGGRRRYW
ncbi:hypothetical protein [Streptomyces sp. NPDC054887]